MEKVGWAEGREKETSIGNIVVVLGRAGSCWQVGKLNAYTMKD